MLSLICKRLNLRQRVTASANVFFRRFFAKNSYSALDPFLVCATCVYVAAKVEESPIHIKSAVAEATRSFTEHGFRGMPTDHSSLAEMEFYLLEEMEFDMVLFHSYRSLIVMFEDYGSGSAVGSGNSIHERSAGAAGSGSGSGSGGGSGGSGMMIGLGIEAAAFGVTKGLASVEEGDAASAIAEEDKVQLNEFNDEVLLMCWFILNDTYKTDIPLMYPPYMVALASIWLGLSLHPPSFDKITASLHTMQTRRDEHHLSIQRILDNPASTPAELASAKREPSPPSQDALTFFASLNVSLPLLAEIVQEMVSAYSVQHQVQRLVSDGPGIVKLLERMRESRRVALIKDRDQTRTHA